MPPAAHVLAFLLVFTVLFLLALVVTIASEFSDVKWVLAIVRIGEGLGRLTLVSIAIAFILVEGIPMLAAWYKKQMEVKAREERQGRGGPRLGAEGLAGLAQRTGSLGAPEVGGGASRQYVQRTAPGLS